MLCKVLATFWIRISIYFNACFWIQFWIAHPYPDPSTMTFKMKLLNFILVYNPPKPPMKASKASFYYML